MVLTHIVALQIVTIVLKLFTVIEIDRCVDPSNLNHAYDKMVCVHNYYDWLSIRMMFSLRKRSRAS